MRAVRERPRVVVARVLAGLLVVVAATGLGILLSGEDESPALQGDRDRLERARSDLAGAARVSHEQAALLHRADAQRRRLHARLRAVTARVRSLARENRGLRRELRRVRPATASGRAGP